MIDIVSKVNNVMLEGATLWYVIDACSVIDIEACFDPIFEPPLDFLEECRKRQEAAQSPFHTTIERKIGNTWYIVETECIGSEPLADKVKRLIFSDKGVAC